MLSVLLRKFLMLYVLPRRCLVLSVLLRMSFGALCSSQEMFYALCPSQDVFDALSCSFSMVHSRGWMDGWMMDSQPALPQGYENPFSCPEQLWLPLIQRQFHPKPPQVLMSLPWLLSPLPLSLPLCSCCDPNTPRGGCSGPSLLPGANIPWRGHQRWFVKD